MRSPYQIVVIGGSAGSFQGTVRILHSLPARFSIPIVLTLHRLKHVRSGFVEALSAKSNLPIVEPDDKERIRAGTVYLAPANYHLLIELGSRFSLSVEEPLNHSRPSIDHTFFSVAKTYRDKAIGIILSGANRDGAMGLKRVKEAGGVAIVQDPQECDMRTMTEASLKATEVNHILTIDGIITFLQRLAE